MRKSIAAGSIALASLAGIGAGVTLAFPGVSSAATEATTTGATTTPAARGAVVTDALAKLVSAGTITQSQADAVATALAEAMPARGGGGHGGAKLSVAATAIGISEADLRTALQGGQSIAQVAAANNVAVEAVAAAMKTDLQTRLAQSVTDGKITQAQADERLAAADARITEQLNRVGLPMHGKGGHGPRNAAPAAPADAAAASAAATTST